jgi:hypothetical protein
VLEQLPHGDAGGVAGHLREVTRERVVELEQPSVLQEEDGGGGERLAQEASRNAVRGVIGARGSRSASPWPFR